MSQMVQLSHERYKTDDRLNMLFSYQHDNPLIFLGMIAILDPPRAGVRSAILKCANAGIEVKMITGDQMGTAKSIGNQVGINTNKNILSK